MNTIIKIGWRNIWRNARRSLITIGAIVTGLWGLVLIFAANNGFLVGMVDMAIQADSSHIQIHAKGYNDNPDINLNMEEPYKIAELASGAEHVKAVSVRGKVRAMLSTARGSSGVTLVGVDPEMEPKVTTVAKSIKEGRYFNSDDEKGVIIGSGLANKLKTKLGRKVVIYARGADSNLKPVGVKVIGIYDTGTDTVDKFMAFVPIAFFQDQLVLGDKAQEIALKIDANENLEEAKAALADLFKSRQNIEILTWKEMFKFLVQIVGMAEITNYVMLIIVCVALSFGIANTMVMSVYERFRELGIMKAVGTSPLRIFFMIQVEAMSLAVTGLFLGTIIGLATLYVWDIYGLDLSLWSESLKALGVPSIIYPEVYSQDWVMTWAAVLVMAVGSSLYPAFKAAWLRPVEAMRM